VLKAQPPSDEQRTATEAPASGGGAARPAEPPEVPQGATRVMPALSMVLEETGGADEQRDGAESSGPSSPVKTHPAQANSTASSKAKDRDAHLNERNSPLDQRGEAKNNVDEIVKPLSAEKHPPKTVFSLLSQMDGVAISVKRQASAEQDEAKSPVRASAPALSCRLQSSDGVAQEALVGAESPVRTRKVATVRQPSIAGIQTSPHTDS